MKYTETDVPEETHKGRKTLLLDMISSLYFLYIIILMSTNSFRGYHLCFTSNNLLRAPTLWFLQHPLEGSTNSLCVPGPIGWKHQLLVTQAPTCITENNSSPLHHPTTLFFLAVTKWKLQLPMFKHQLETLRKTILPNTSLPP